MSYRCIYKINAVILLEMPRSIPDVRRAVLMKNKRNYKP